jgi:hypothetical protein
LFHGGTRICRRAEQSKNSGRRRDKSPTTGGFLTRVLCNEL